MRHKTGAKGLSSTCMDSYDGVLLVDKDDGETSFDVVKKIRRILALKKVGHAGTLDPFATGLLIILIGQGTKLSPYLMAGEKQYRATIKLGVETDTLDPTGRVMGTGRIPDLGPKEIEEIIQTFVGNIEQEPPAFSALNINGKRAYELARKGQKVELRKRVVEIRAISIISIDMPFISIEVTCSGGTYIRSLASDIGKGLGTVGHLSYLRRLSSGPFHVSDSLKSGQIETVEPEQILAENVLTLGESLPDMKELNVDILTASKISRGYRPEWEEVAGESYLYNTYSGFIKIVNDTALIAVMDVDLTCVRDKRWLKNMRVFN